MSFKDILEKNLEKRRKLEAEMIRPEIRDLASRGNVTWAEYDALLMNSWEREALHPALTDEALICLLETIMLPNCSTDRSKPAVTYNDAVINNFVPELIKRLKAKSEAIYEAAKVAESVANDLRSMSPDRIRDLEEAMSVLESANATN